MKKLVFGLAAVMMCVSLAGCGGKFHRILLKRDI